MDNFRMDVTSENKDMLRTALSLVFTENMKAVAYSVEEGVLIFYWLHIEGVSTEFPLEVDLERDVEWAWAWLEQQDYGPKPDIDGDCGQAWRVYNEAWGHVKGRTQAIIAIEPAWAMYGT